MDTYAKQTPFVAGIRTSSRNPLLSPASKYTEKYSELETCPGVFFPFPSRIVVRRFPTGAHAFNLFWQFRGSPPTSHREVPGFTSHRGFQICMGKRGGERKRKRGSKISLVILYLHRVFKGGGGLKPNSLFASTLLNVGVVFVVSWV